MTRIAAPARHPETAESISADEFTAAFRQHPGGVAVITADAGAGPVGLTATSVVSLSAEPPLLAFSASALSSSTPTLLAAASVVVHLLSAAQLEIAQLCATSGIDRFADRSVWGRLATGEPFFPAARTWLRGEVVQHVELGAATLLIVRVTGTGSSEAAREDAPLVYHSRSWHRLGEHSAFTASQ